VSSPKQKPRSIALIEKSVDELLRAFMKASGLRTLSMPIPLDDIAMYLELRIDFDSLEDLGYDNTYGALFASQRTILIDEHLDRPSEVSVCNYTIGHEIGHWVLHTTGLQLDLFRFSIHNPANGHRNHRPRGAPVRPSSQLTLFDERVRHSLAPPVCRESRRGSAPEIEAERFSAALLMPSSLVKRAMRRLFGTDHLVCHSDDTVTRGALGLTGQHSAGQIASLVARELAPKFRVSVQAMEYRLKRLNLLITPG